MRVTINDIAKKAQVSPSTVSRVIADSPLISAATKEKVLKIIKEMNYHPNIIARSLVNRSSRIIGVVMPGMAEQSFQHPFFPELLAGIASMANKEGYKILLANVATLDEEREMVKELTFGSITAGLILLTSRDQNPTVDQLVEVGFPFVVIGRTENPYVNWVDNDNFLIGYQLVEHFLDQGHRRVAFLGYSPGVTVTRDRLHGYKKALVDHGIPFCEELVVESEFISANGYDLMKRLLALRERPTAVIACDDLLAFGAIKAIHEAGLKVPVDIAVAGINNVPLAEFYNPPLTSVKINAFTLGKKAFEMLQTVLTSDVRSYNRAIIPAELVVRSSSLATKE
ncbi:MAG TPA: LacI family transcriptional regulator [Firmicutes bacterium]|uniref:LacI family DNA-binding transcriptional regulator n=1 Tax=Capillibacterium thermochitinicola TaxID=2699427 RepID=A0A8J6I3P6_9FIRM|nr:LacI family DNA-binding transcriptional regulator [Capillibacterium thermochitinicola]MBA2134064.1 LacI family DNA-binding transcriptional regulator [Capillibacterium thermochitinicola]HHW12874.1 LacI family transcriptional regulator [Bacillota bacterium]